jgi:DNA/RNA-binding domain of Phe-tRNA-synthetase-like protein
MYFSHSSRMWGDYAELVPGVLYAQGISRNAVVDEQIARFSAIAASRLAASSETELPEVQAWRRTFSKMGLKPTQYRCASESLLRRYKKEKVLPRIHPLIDLCNAISLAFAIPIAVFDVSKVSQSLEVRHATGVEEYLAFSGELEQPEVGEVIFADDMGKAHARRWTNRQSRLSAVSDETNTILIVAEAMHAAAADDIRRLIETLEAEINAIWSVAARTAILSQHSSRFEF